MTRTPRAFAAAARAAGVPVNVIDKPAFCDFSFGAIVNRSPLVIGISTDGAAPVFAQAIRAKLEALLPQGFAGWAAAARRWRAAREGIRPVVRRPAQVLAAVHRACGRQSRQRAGRAPTSTASSPRCTGLGSAVENGSVTLVGAGPGDPELLTLRAVRALQSADVILFDDLVSRDVLDFARREARKMLVGKTGYGPSCKQDDINALMVALAQAGQARGAAQGRRPADLRPRRRGDRGLPRGRISPSRSCPASPPRRARRARLGIPLTDRSAGAPPAIRHRPCPRRRAAGRHRLAEPRRSVDHHRDLHAGEDARRAWSRARSPKASIPQTPALAIARATRPDQQSSPAPIADLPARLRRGGVARTGAGDDRACI